MIILQDTDLILNIVRSTNAALVAVDLDGKVKFWNKYAENLLGYTEKEVIGKSLPFIKKEFTYEIEKVIATAKEGKAINFKTTKQRKDGSEIELVVHANPIQKDNSIIGISMLLQELSILKKVCYLPFGTENYHKEPKRTFIEIRDIIFLTLGDGRKTINQISNESGVNWRTVEKHLTYLIGKRYVCEVFSSEYVRIFELTEVGLEYFSGMQARALQKHVKKV